MNCPLAKAFTKTPSILYQKFLMEFWCIAIAYDPHPPSDDSVARLLKEYKIKFSMMNGKKPLNLDVKTFYASIGLDYNKDLDVKTFYASIGLDYNKGKYVFHPSLGAVKVELAKIVLDGNYSSTKQINSIQQMIAYCLITRTKVDIEEIIYSDLLTRLISKSRQNYVSYPRFVLCA
ncbi:hypothetical protein Tco_1355592 [Tanacetum coccineum]